MLKIGKVLGLLALILLTQGAQALTAVAAAELSEHKLAMRMALEASIADSLVDCHDNANLFYSVIMGGQALEIEEKGPEATLQVIQDLYVDARYILTVQTTAKRSRFKELSLQEYHLQAVNHGDVVHPKIVNEWIPQNLMKCD
jgi:hypothetical protein